MIRATFSMSRGLSLSSQAEEAVSAYHTITCTQTPSSRHGAGIGLMIAQALETNGAIVYIMGRRKESLEKAAGTAVSCVDTIVW